MSKYLLPVGVLVAIVISLTSLFSRPAEKITEVVRELGAVATLDGLDSPYAKVNNLRQYYYSQPFVATSSVVCSIKNPLQSTSTLLSYGAVITSIGSIGKTENVDLGTSTTALGTSSPALVKNKPMAALGNLVWLPSSATTTGGVLEGIDLTSGNSNIVIGPNDYVNLRISTGTPKTMASYWGGRCTGLFQSL